MNISFMKEIEKDIFELYNEEMQLICLAKQADLIQRNIGIGAYISDELLDALDMRAKILSAKREAVRILGRSDRTKFDLIQRLMQKGHEKEAAQAAADYMEEKQYINDEEYAKKYIKDAVLIFGKPLKTVKAKLLAKGIRAHVIDEIFEEYQEEDLENLDRITAKLLEKSDGSREAMQKIYNKLQYKGYSYYKAKESVQRCLAEFNFDNDDEFCGDEF